MEVFKAPDDDIMTLDFTNAFGLIDRSLILSVIKRDFPSLFPLVKSGYGDISTLLFGDIKVTSSTGVQQGDPAGPLLFSAALSEVQRWVFDELEATGRQPPELVGSYLDDIVIGGYTGEVQQYVELLRQIGSTVGLVLNERKCEHFPKHFLGGSLGSDDDITQEVTNRVAAASTVLATIESFGHQFPQEAYWILRQCAGRCLVQYSQRLHGPHPMWATYDSVVRRVSATIMGIESSCVIARPPLPRRVRAPSV